MTYQKLRDEWNVVFVEPARMNKSIWGYEEGDMGGISSVYSTMPFSMTKAQLSCASSIKINSTVLQESS